MIPNVKYGTSSVTSTVTGLQPNTTYYVSIGEFQRQWRRHRLPVYRSNRQCHYAACANRAGSKSAQYNTKKTQHVKSKPCPKR